MSHDYKPGDKIECRLPNGPWVPLGTYLATSSTGTIVCERHGRSIPNWADSATETRRVPDTITVTVEIDRQGAEEIAAWRYNPATDSRGRGRRQAFRAFIDAVTKAVEQ